jgi:hypothetical protein
MLALYTLPLVQYTYLLPMRQAKNKTLGNAKDSRQHFGDIRTYGDESRRLLLK